VYTLQKCHPFKEGELAGLLREAGFKNIDIYSDYEKGRNPKAEFFTYVAS
jgi:hypothetical protein